MASVKSKSWSPSEFAIKVGAESAGGSRVDVALRVERRERVEDEGVQLGWKAGRGVVEPSRKPFLRSLPEVVLGSGVFEAKAGEDKLHVPTDPKKQTRDSIWINIHHRPNLPRGTPVLATCDRVAGFSATCKRRLN